MFDSEKFINAVRGREGLWRKSVKQYSEKTQRQILWEEVAREMYPMWNTYKLSDRIKIATDCKARWGHIRDNYRKSLRKLAMKSGQATGKKIKKYKYFSQLQFLESTLEEGKAVSNIPNDNNNETEEEHSWQDDTIETESHETNIQNSTICEDSVYTSQQNLKPVSSFKRKCKEPNTASLALMKYLVDINQEKSQAKSEKDPVDAFLAGIAPTLKSFSPYYLNLAKGKIFSVVQEYELAMIMDKEKTKMSSEHRTTKFLAPSTSSANTSHLTYSNTPLPISTLKVSENNAGHTSSTSTSFETPIPSSSINFNATQGD